MLSRRVAILPLILLLFFNTLGYYLVFYGDVLAAKHEAKLFIFGHGKDEKATYFSFRLSHGKPMAQGLFFTDDDEFTYQGRMYDIESNTQSNDSVTYKCYSDDTETTLNNELCNKIDADRDSAGQRHKNSATLKEFANDYTPHRPDHFVFVQPLTASGGLTHRSSRILFFLQPVISPPPEYFI